MPEESEEKDRRKPFDLRNAAAKLLLISLAGVVTYSLIDPLKELARNFVWREDIELSEPKRVNAVVGVPEGFQVSIVSRSTVAGISGGSIAFSHAGPELEIIGKTHFIFDRSDGPITVPKDEKVTLVAHSIGIHELSARIETQRGAVFNDEIDVKAEPRVRITQRDYSGVWHVVLNGVEGSMVLDQNSPSDRHFGGKIELADGRVLAISREQSRWDGSTLVIYATAEDGSEYNIQSMKCRVKIDDTFWVFAHGDYKRMKANGTMERVEYEDPTYVEECPDDVQVSPRRGSGSFFARAESH